MKYFLLILALLITPCFAQHSIESFTLGTSADEVVSRIGEPSSIGDPQFDPSSKNWVWEWGYPGQGALFEVQSKTQSGSKEVRSVTIFAPSAWKLDGKIGLGSNSAEVLRIFPAISRVNDQVWIAKDKSSHMVTGFELNGVHVKTIFVGTIAK